MQVASKLSNKDLTVGITLVVVGTILFSSKAIVVKYAYTYGVEPLMLQALRMLFVLPLYSAILSWLLIKGGSSAITTASLFGAICAGIACYHIASYLDLIGLMTISAGLERVILFCYPAIAVIMGWVFLGEKPTKQIGLAVTVSYAGILLFFLADVNISGTGIWFGSVMVFIASILTAWYMVANQHYSRQMGSQRFTCIAMIAACTSMLSHAVVQGVEGIAAQPQPVYISALGIAIFCTLIPSFMVSAGVKTIGASRAGVVGAIGPLITIVLSNWLLNEPVTSVHIIAIGLVIVGMRLLR
ncbi:DMT family transporter [Alteromonas sediminis]|uniref:DMT family transporter n=1 Tax=Alteromonas sediminis TaxID=2259342 RepID=A0A3N5YLF5_9ALTE|nr:DMT family transporter [Alteromonas sediminis]RPJ65941.1 DMT family transporter [Alteromonas sediminis]